MRQISRIEKLTSGRYLVTLADETSFPLYGKEVSCYGIEEGGALADAAFEEILQEILPKRAKMRAMHLLQTRDRTEQELRRKLAEGFYPEEIVNDAVEYVRSYHYIDDVRYAASYLECRKETKSCRQLEQELYRKGISREDVAAALAGTELPDEETQIVQWIEKKRFCIETADQKETERMIRFLLRRGYGMAAIRRVLRGAYKDLL